LIVPSLNPETIFVPSGENATDLTTSLWALVFSLNSSSLAARQASRSQFWPRRGEFEDESTPESQTSIVPSHDPDTILVPSWENATDTTEPALVLVVSATQLMSVAIILRTREKREALGCMRAFGSMEIWDHKRLQARRPLEVPRHRHATANRVPQG